ncbi:MAG: hypothetical protein M1831_002579 [Alyxoria varia]|nr:MAG: hypothetical protein M1831_002579 [Alyxoria varia]
MGQVENDDSFGWDTSLEDDLVFYSLGSNNSHNDKLEHRPAYADDLGVSDELLDAVLDDGLDNGDLVQMDEEPKYLETVSQEKPEADQAAFNKQLQSLDTVSHEESKNDQIEMDQKHHFLGDPSHEKQKSSLRGLEKEHKPLHFAIEKPEDTKTSDLNSAKEGPFAFNFSRLANGQVGTRNKWWTHKLYQGPDGAPVAVRYSRTLLDSEFLAKKFLQEPILGFDMEWLIEKYACKNKACKEKHSHYLQQKISLIQIASESQVGLFHIALHKGSKVEDVVAPTLRRIIESRDHIKAGVGINYADAKRLKRFFNIQAQGLMELNDLHSMVNKNFVKSRAKLKFTVLVHIHLGMPLNKDQGTRCSNWSKTLNPEQITYAAADAYAGYVLFQVLENKRKVLRPAPPRPEFAETLKTSRRGRDAATKAGKNVSDPSPIKKTGVSAVKKGNQATCDITRKDLYNLRKTIHKKILELCPENIQNIATDETVDLLASIRPSNVQQLSKIAGASRFSKCANQWDLDLLEVLHWARSSEGSSQKENAQPPQQRSSKRKAEAIHSRSPSSEDAFEVGPDSRGQHAKERGVNSTRRGQLIEHVDLTGYGRSICR